MFWTRKPATMPMVVGRLAAQTPSRFSVRSSMLEATTRGGAHAKHAVSPGDTYCKKKRGIRTIHVKWMINASFKKRG